jgi:hypothetical protein
VPKQRSSARHPDQEQDRAGSEQEAEQAQGKSHPINPLSGGVLQAPTTPQRPLVALFFVETEASGRVILAYLAATAPSPASLVRK